MRSLTMVAGVLIAFALGCGKFGANSNINTNSNANTAYTNRNSNNDNSSPSPTPDTYSSIDKTPLSLTVSDMVEGSGDESNVGKMTTVTGGVLEDIRSDSLLIRGQYGGAAFYCYGDFTDYMSMADRVKSLNSSGKAPKVTVKGVYKVASVGSGGELNPCVLSDIEKP